VADVDEIAIVRGLDGSLRLEEGTIPPPVVGFAPAVVEMIRAGQCGWATVELDPEARHSSRGRHVIVLWLTPEPLRYVLTGETDPVNGLIAERVPG
jgi:hypothetical protein